MNRLKCGFTTVELLISISILFVILMLCVSIIILMNTTLFSGQLESQNRTGLSDNIFFITREIQSAEKIIVEEKSIKIKQLGTDGYNLEYTIVDGNPFGALNFNDKKVLDLDYTSSRFSIDGNAVNITLAVVKNNLDFKQTPKTISFDVTARSEGALIE